MIEKDMKEKSGGTLNSHQQTMTIKEFFYKGEEHFK